MRVNKKSLAISLAVTVAMVAIIGGMALNVSHAKDTAKSDPAAQTPANNDWQARCQDVGENETVASKYCEAVQSLYVIQKNDDPEKSTTQRVAEMAVGYPPGSTAKAAQAVAILPLGIVVNEEVSVEVDGKRLFKFEVRFCDVGGCVGIFNIDKGVIEKMRKGKELSFKTKTVSGQPVVIGLPLSGFDTVIGTLIPVKR